MIEAEIKARVRDPQGLRSMLGQWADEETSLYRDVYFDHPDGSLAQDGRELRVRTVESAQGRRVVLTYKGQAADAETGSKPETETQVADPEAVEGILLGLGFVRLIAFEKHCANYSFTRRGRKTLATVVTVPELDGTFLEIETIAANLEDLAPALGHIRALLAEVEIDPEDWTSELYTEAVMQRRQEAR